MTRTCRRSSSLTRINRTIPGPGRHVTRGLGPFDTFMVEPLRMCTVTVTPRQPTRTTGDVASPSHQRQLDRDERRFAAAGRASSPRWTSWWPTCSFGSMRKIIRVLVQVPGPMIQVAAASTGVSLVTTEFRATVTSKAPQVRMSSALMCFMR